MNTGAAPDDKFALYCGRLSCREVIVQSIGRGRRKEYCSETCRRGAERDYKRAKSLVELFEEQLRETQHEVAAYGRKGEQDLLTPDELLRLQADARVAFGRADLMVELGVPPERAMEALEALVSAVRPLLAQGQTWIPLRSA